MSMHDLAQLGITFRPINQWPAGGKCTDPGERSTPFKAPLSDTAKILAKELRALDAKRGILLEINLRENDVRLDGMPRADARVGHPGVILTFDCRHGTLRPFTDACTTWQHNLRAIAMHLEHLRLAGLYGVGRGGEQYSGWKALPAPTPDQSSAFVNEHDAAAFLGELAIAAPLGILTHAVNYQLNMRETLKTYHPDQGGDVEIFKRLMQAKRILDKHHGL